MNNQIPGSSRKNSRFPNLWHDLLLFSCGGLLVIAIAALIVWNPLDVKAFSNPVPQEKTSKLAAPQALSEHPGSDNMRLYYLTYMNPSGSNATNSNVCVEGFHMASAWELLDPSNLQYYHFDQSHDPADAGYGPPAYVSGWVHTGFDFNTSETVGMANCGNWSLEGQGEAGTIMYLPGVWNDSYDLGIWDAGSDYCSINNFVWCIQDAIDVTPPMRQYYLTKDSTIDGAEADGSDDFGAGVCAFGYHFASIWEIIDPSNLQYNVNQGCTRSDSGMGPPSGVKGWIRTGDDSNSDPATLNLTNCDKWQTSSSRDYGQTVSLPTDWEDVYQQSLHVWSRSDEECSSQQRVWCVADEVNSAGSCALPERINCGQTVRGSTWGMPSHLDNYECTSWDESGPEVVYALNLPELEEDATYDVTASIEIIDPQTDLDIFFLTKDGCSTGATMNEGACGNSEVNQYDLEPGTYYIVVDGYDGAWGDFYLNVTCSPTLLFIPDVQK